MSKSALRTSVLALAGRLVKSAYIFNDEHEAHGVVLSLDDGTDISIEFNYETRVAAEVLQLKSEEDVAVVVKTEP